MLHQRQSTAAQLTEDQVVKCFAQHLTMHLQTLQIQSFFTTNAPINKSSTFTHFLVYVNVRCNSVVWEDKKLNI